MFTKVVFSKYLSTYALKTNVKIVLSNICYHSTSEILNRVKTSFYKIKKYVINLMSVLYAFFLYLFGGYNMNAKMERKRDI